MNSFQIRKVASRLLRGYTYEISTNDLVRKSEPVEATDDSSALAKFFEQAVPGYHLKEVNTIGDVYYQTGLTKIDNKYEIIFTNKDTTQVSKWNILFYGKTKSIFAWKTTT